jgi:phage-related minor tail protein
MTQQASQFTFRLSATGGDQLVRILRNAGDAGEQMAARIQRGAQAAGPALEAQRAQIDQVRVAMERTQATAASGIGGSGFERGLTQGAVLLARFSAQLTGGSSQLAQFAQQATRLTGALSGGFAGLAVSLAAVAAQYLFANRATNEAQEAAVTYAAAMAAANEALETAAERSRRLAQERRNEAAATAEAAAQAERDTIAQGNAAAVRALAVQERLRAAVAEGRAPPSVLQGGAARAQETARGIAAQVEQAGVRLITLEAQIARLRAPVPENAPAAAGSAGRGAAQNNAQLLAELTRRNQEAERQAEALARANRTVDEVYQDQIESINRLLPELERLFGVERANEIAARASVEAFNERARALERGTERAAGGARELGFAFSSAFEDAILKGKRLSDVLRGLASDIARVILRRSVTDPLANAAAGILGGINFRGLFGPSASTNVGGVPFSAVTNANGNIFSSGSVVPFARGGIVNGPTMFPIAGGRTGLMGEAGPEAIMPLARDGAGRLGVRGGAPSVTVVNNIDARGADPASEARIFAAIRASSEQTRAAVFDAIRRGGSARAIVRGA